MTIAAIDLAFVLDCTGSMGSYIQQAKENIEKIASEIARTEKSNVRLALINYRDHPGQPCEINHFTENVNDLKSVLNRTSAHGGGDAPEAICCALEALINRLKWRDSACKVAILICDAPPHGLEQHGDSYPNGCPDKNDPVDLAHHLAANGISLYCAGCEPALFTYRNFFIALTLITGGQYIPLKKAENLTQLIVGGTREEVSMEKLMADVHNEVMREAAESGKRVDEDELTKRVHKLLNERGSTINSVRMSGLTGSDDNEEIKLDEACKEASKTKSLVDMVTCLKNHNKLTCSQPLFGAASFGVGASFKVSRISRPRAYAATKPKSRMRKTAKRVRRARPALKRPKKVVKRTGATSRSSSSSKLSNIKRRSAGIAPEGSVFTKGLRRSQRIIEKRLRLLSAYPKAVLSH